MGYYQATIDCNILIPQAGFSVICKHLLDSGFLKNTDKMHGGSMNGKGGFTDKWYSWCDMARLEKKITTGDLPAVFEEFGFDVQQDDGNIVGLSYDNKAGDEFELFRAIAPFMDDGMYVDFRGEDGEFYRYYFKDQEARQSQGEISFPMP